MVTRPVRRKVIGRIAAVAVAVGVLCLSFARPAAAGGPVYVGSGSEWVAGLPKTVWAGGRPLTFAIEARQTSRYTVVATFFVGMFNRDHVTGPINETRGIVMQWQDPRTGRWQAAYGIDSNGGWNVGPRGGLAMTRDKTVKLQVRVWFHRSAWAGRWQMEGIISGYEIFNASGRTIAAQLRFPDNPQYFFTLRR